MSSGFLQSLNNNTPCVMVDPCSYFHIHMQVYSEHTHAFTHPQFKQSSSSTPCAAFVTDYGRQVLPFLSTATSGTLTKSENESCMYCVFITVMMTTYDSFWHIKPRLGLLILKVIGHIIVQSLWLSCYEVYFSWPCKFGTVNTHVLDCC